MNLDTARRRTRTRAAAAGGSATLDVEELAAFLDGEHAALKAQVRTVLGRPEFAYAYDIDRTSYRRLILRRCRALARHGWGARFYPDAHGRRDLGGFLAVVETLAFSDPNLLIKFGLQFGLFGGAIFHLGTRRHHDEYLPQVASMKLIGCFAMTEVGHGSDIRCLETVARYDRARDELIVHTPSPPARKQFIGNAALHAHTALVFAQLEVDEVRRGVFGFLVPLRAADGSLRPGVAIGDTGPKSGLHGIDNGWIAFDRVRVPRENLLDRFGTVTPAGRYRGHVEDPTDAMLRTMSESRLGLAWAGLSAAKAGLAIAIRYGAARRPFGAGEARLLLDYPLHQRRLLPRLAAAFALDAALKHATARAGASAATADPEFEALTAALKAYSTWNAVETLQACREACGGQGYLAVNRLGVVRADADAWTTLEGDNTLLYLLAAKTRLKRFRDAGRSAWLRAWLAQRWQKAAIALSLRAPAPARAQNPARLLEMLRFRERALLWEAAGRLRAARGREPQADYQTPLMALSQAGVERVVLEEFSRQVERSPPSIRPVLAPLRELYALSCLAGHSSWYLQNGAMSRRYARAIDGRVAALCRRIRPHAPSLADGFAIPDACLGAPIAHKETQEV